MDRIPEKLVINSKSNKIFISFDEIIYCKADGPYSIIKLVSGRSFQICRPLKHLDEQFVDTSLFRANRQYLVNLFHIEKCIRNRHYKIIMNNGESICVSVRNVPAMNKKIEELFIII